MKIGILTYHRALNYGACFQAIATRILLERMGHSAFYIDYWPEYHKTKYEAFSTERLLKLPIKQKVTYLIDVLRYYRFKVEKINNYKAFFDKYVNPYCVPIDTDFDLVLYGSDQIWRYQYELMDYNPVYFANNTIHAKKHVAFSASMGVLPHNIAMEARLKSLLENFSSISVRENDLWELLDKIGFKSTITLDPTLLLTNDDWDSIIPTPGYSGHPYALVYGPDAFDVNSIKEFAKSKGLETKIILFSPEHKDTEFLITTQGPSKFIELFKNASFIFSSSFHGLAFSIIYKKNFLVSYEQNSNRAQTLLDSLGLSNRIIPPHTGIPQDIEDIDYSLVGSKMEVAVNDSVEFLRKHIEVE